MDNFFSTFIDFQFVAHSMGADCSACAPYSTI